MPGDGITDVAPLTQQQWNGWYPVKSQKRPYGSQAVERWIDLLLPWDVAVTAHAQQQYLQPKPRQRDARIPLLDIQDGWVFAPADTTIQATVGAVQHHVGIPTPKRKALPRQYLAQDIAVDVYIDPTILSNITAWFPGVSAHMAQEPRRVSSITLRERNAYHSMYTLQERISTSFFAVVTETIGKVNYTGGRLVLP